MHVGIRMKNKRTVLIVISLLLMVTGLAVYLFFNQTADVSRYVLSILTVPVINWPDNALTEFIICYGADLLWSTAFTLTIQAVLGLTKKQVWLLMFCSVLGFLYEFMQLSGLAKGTADIGDVLIYLVGSLLGVLIIFGGKLYEKE